MSLAHLVAQPVVERRGIVVAPLGPWEEPRPEPKRIEKPDAERREDFRRIEDACERMGFGITSVDLAAFLHIRVGSVSQHLVRMRRRGQLEVTARQKIPPPRGGRPMLVYRWVGR